MTRDGFRKLIENGAVLLDGGTGTNLIEQGMPQGVCAEEWIYEHPEIIEALQRGYIEAGSNIILAPTFGANRERLKGFKKDAGIRKLNIENVALSKKAAGGKALVAGDMSMTGIMIYPDDDESFEEAVEVYREQAGLLLEAGCDLFAVETMISLEDARAAVTAIRQICDLPVMATMTFEPSGRTLYGDTPENAAKVLEEAGADAIGSNCGAGPSGMGDIIEKMHSSTCLPVIAKPNAGLPKTTPDGKIIYDLSPEIFAEEMKELMSKGALIVGGCCGTTPKHIEALAKVL